MFIVIFWLGHSWLLSKEETAYGWFVKLYTPKDSQGLKLQIFKWFNFTADVNTQTGRENLRALMIFIALDELSFMLADSDVRLR